MINNINKGISLEVKVADTIINIKNNVDCREEILEVARETFKIEADSINMLIDRLNDTFVEAVKILYQCKGRVIITGMGKSGIIGKKIAATFSSTGTPSYFLHPAESTHGDSGVLTKDDIVIAISNSGETAELLKLLPIIKRFGVNLIGLTGKPKSTLALASDIVIDISVEKEACPLGLAPTASTTATLAMGDALAVSLLKRRGFTSDDFLIFHPSGSLGKGLFWKVEDLMITGDKIPFVLDTMNFKNAIVKITEKKLGMAIVINESNQLQGILTDGDIRRVLLKNIDIEELKVFEAMTKDPKTIEKNALAAKALQIMEKYSITSLVITNENNNPEGVIHIHDLLKAGVA